MVPLSNSWGTNRHWLNLVPLCLIIVAPATVLQFCVLWIGSREEDFLPTLVLKQLFLPKHQCPQAPAGSSLLRNQNMPKSLLDQVHPMRVQMTAMPFPSISFYPLCQELILSSSFPSPINNPFSPHQTHGTERGMPMSYACTEHSFCGFYLLGLLVLFFHPYQDLQTEVVEGQS